MHTLSAKLTVYIPHAVSLKDKRQVCHAIIDKTLRKFNASIAEVDTQGIHQTLTIGAAVVSGEFAHAQNMLDEVVRFMEEHADAELTEVSGNMHELIVEKSRFIACAVTIDSEEAAKAYITEIPRQHKKARHVVFAYLTPNCRPAQ